MEEGSTLKTWWNENKGTYWSTYEEEGLNVDDLKQGWNVEYGNGWFNNTTESTANDAKPKAVASLLNALLENKDGCMDALYENFKEGNIKKLENQVMTGPGSYTTTRQTIAEALKNALNGTALAAWNAGSQVSITLNKIPKTLSFGLGTVESEENPQSANITIAEDADTKENNLTFLLLGTKSESAFGYSNLTADNLQLPSGDFPGQALTPNVSTSYRVYPEGEFSWDSMTDQYSDVYFSYKTLIEKFIELGLGSNLEYTDWAAGGSTTGGGPFYYALVPIYNISNTAQWEFDEEGQINHGSDKQFTIKVPVPDFSSMKDFSIKWEVDNGLGNSITE